MGTMLAESTELRGGNAAGGCRRLYYLDPLETAGPEGWEAAFAGIAGLGFETVVLPPPFYPAGSGNRLLIAELDRVHPALGGGPVAPFLRRLAERARGAGLSVLLDLPFACLAAGSAAATQAGSRFGAPDLAGVRDPRRQLSTDTAPARLHDAAAAQSLGGWWGRMVSDWHELGIAGVRLLGLSDVSPTLLPTLLTGLRGAARDATLFGWGAGLDAAGRAALRGAGLDLVSGSQPWWDWRAEWLFDEAAELQGAGTLIGVPEAPFGPRLALGVHDGADLAAVLGRALSLASSIGGGWMVPSGLEFGRRQPLDPERRSFGEERAKVIDLSASIASLNETLRGRRVVGSGRRISAPGAPLLALLHTGASDPRFADRAELLLVNADPVRSIPVDPASLLPATGGAFAGFQPLDRDGPALHADAPLDVPAGAALGFVATRAQRDVRPALRPETARQAAASPRIGLEDARPCVDGGRFPVRRIAGDVVSVEVDVICDGHDQLGAVLLWRAPGSAAWQQTRLRPLGNDRWQARFPLETLGTYRYNVEAWRDAFATFRDELGKKHQAGVPVVLELREGAALVEQAAKRVGGGAGAALRALLGPDAPEARLAALLSPALATAMQAADDRPFAVRLERDVPIDCERLGAQFASWYEVFPRSMSDDPDRHGTFRDVERHLPRVRAMGFDVLYFPPIHPIGRKNRKGRNNTLTPSPSDPGSPYAIGSDSGGHDALHPELGTLAEFLHMRQAAENAGIEIAIDFAIQCSPDHPWLREHKDWFAWRPDGSIRYAENPPKKYEDIVNVDFYASGAIPGLWLALCNVVLFWCEQGVRLFRVDNPHTKPLPFWEWMIGEVRARHPDAVFLAEAFTRPKVMYRLAKVGFSQSYTYFTWRNSKRELADYLTELDTTAPRDFFRPHFFVNTPDINPVFLQTSGRPGFLIRAALAATLSGLWGVYSGFELCEGRPLPGREEYLDSEKYEIKAWDWDRPGNIVAEVAQLNAIRRANPALHTHLNVTFLAADNGAVLFYEKATADRSNVLLIAVSMDPSQPQEAAVELPLWRWSLPDQASLAVEDLVAPASFTLGGKMQRIRLTPELPYAIWRVRPSA